MTDNLTPKRCQESRNISLIALPNDSKKQALLPLSSIIDTEEQVMGFPVIIPAIMSKHKIRMISSIMLPVALMLTPPALRSGDPVTLEALPSWPGLLIPV